MSLTKNHLLLRLPFVAALVVLSGCALAGRQHAVRRHHHAVVATANHEASNEGVASKSGTMTAQRLKSGVTLASAVQDLEDDPTRELIRNSDQIGSSDELLEPPQRLNTVDEDLRVQIDDVLDALEIPEQEQLSREELQQLDVDSMDENLTDTEAADEDAAGKEEAGEEGDDAAAGGDVDGAAGDSSMWDRDCVDTNPLSLTEVLESVADSYPLLEVALAELRTADGKALATWGSFDSVLSGYSISKPLGFYETYRNGVKLARPLWNGGEVYGGYRIGRGVFEPWYLERQTNEGGEFKTGVKQPLLKGYAIDGRRAAIQTAQLERMRLEPDIRARVIGMQLAASQIYWKWVASGKVVRMQSRLVELARQRNENLIKRVEAGDLPKITEIDNGRFIAKRQVKLVESRRKLQEAAIKLSLFFRDMNGQPLLVENDRLPCDFPASDSIDEMAIDADISAALAQRPELLELDFLQQQVEVELCYAQNQTLPKLDAYAEAGQDVGEPTSSKRDKSEFELEVGLLAEVPLQRRAACGKIQAAQGKLAQIAAKRRFTEDKIRSQVQDAVSALRNAYDRIEQARENVRLSEQSLRLGRLRFEEGDIDIIALNIYETSLADAELLLIEAEFAYFVALAEYRAALAVSL